VTFDLGLQGRRALVMGGTKGIGAAPVDILRDAGAKIEEVHCLIAQLPA
jgi:NAD(P)-dependent dehydrogenase (short-subunit alcohol dehydrogenase family)